MEWYINQGQSWQEAIKEHGQNREKKDTGPRGMKIKVEKCRYVEMILYGTFAGKERVFVIMCIL